MDINRNFILIEFDGISRLMEFSKFFKYRVDIGGNFRLINFSGFFKFWFGVRMVYYKIFLLIIKSGK